MQDFLNTRIETAHDVLFGTRYVLQTMDIIVAAQSEARAFKELLMFPEILMSIKEAELQEKELTDG